MSDKLHLITFDAIAVRFLEAQGYEAVPCASEDEARARVEELIPQRKWPCYFAVSNTTGEKDFEEFYTEGEALDMSRFDGIGVIRNALEFNADQLDAFVADIAGMKAAGIWSRRDLVALFNRTLPGFVHRETGRFLDDRM